jgi:hypothetical protein
MANFGDRANDNYGGEFEDVSLDGVGEGGVWVFE